MKSSLPIAAIGFLASAMTVCAAPPDAAIVVESGGSIGGSGEAVVDTGIWVESGGSLEPGAPFGAMGIDGTLSLQPDSLMIAEVGGKTPGTNFDTAAVGGAVSIAGNLQVQLANGFVPGLGDAFAILTGNSVAGRFSLCSLPLLTGRKTFRPTYDAMNVVLTVGLIATFAEWKCSRFTIAEQADPLISGALADPDHDHVGNKLEYFFGTEPHDATSSGRLSVSIAVQSNQRFLTLTFFRAQGITDTDFVVETTTSLLAANGWITAAHEIIATVPFDGFDALVVRIMPALSPADVHQFVRLRLNHAIAVRGRIGL